MNDKNQNPKDRQKDKASNKDQEKSQGTLKLFEGMDIETDTAPALLRKMIEQNPAMIFALTELNAEERKIYNINLAFAKRYHIPELEEFVFNELWMKISEKRKGRKEIIEGLRLSPNYDRRTMPVSDQQSVKIEP
jgi:hypothetical protein